ncbi:MAG: hypothetical protein ABI887_15860 [Burkholderiales bacterium]
MKNATLDSAVCLTHSVAARSSDVSLLAWALGCFGVLRIVAYLPMLQTMHTTGASDQHSLLAWLTFLGANATMAMWMYRGNGGQCNRAVLLNAINTVMCAAICVLITWMRLAPVLVR